MLTVPTQNQIEPIQIQHKSESSNGHITQKRNQEWGLSSLDLLLFHQNGSISGMIVEPEFYLNDKFCLFLLTLYPRFMIRALWR